jgi:serine/threonine protein kinase
MPLEPGTRLGPYEILALLGAGGMGEVYAARDTRLGRTVALKTLNAALSGGEDARRRFFLEAKAASALNHPNIVTIHDIGCDGGCDYLVMELVDGKPLDKLIPPSGMPVDSIVRHGTQIADALAKAHAAGIVHRDLKPANVMVTPEGLVKILDFGLAKPVRAPDPEGATASLGTAVGVVLGTAAYMSPEQAEGKPVDARSDIFSFGVMLYEMACGRRPFQGDSYLSTMAAVLRDEPAAPAGAPSALSALIQRCLRKDREQRVQSMAELKVGLESLAAQAAPKRNSATPFLAVAAVVLLAGAGAWYIWSSRLRYIPSYDPIALTSYPGNETSPAFSPEGNQVVFVWDGEKEDNPDIYVKPIGPAPPLRLTTDPRPDFGPKWSPDGRSIAFLRATGYDTVAVMLVPPQGGPERQVGKVYTRSVFGLMIASLCWTADSQALLLTGSLEKGKPNSLLRLSLATGAMKMMSAVTDVSDGYLRAEVSPDGAAVAMIRFGARGDLYLLSLSRNGQPGRLRAMETGRRDIRGIAWTPDGKSLLLGLTLNNPQPLFRIPVAGGEPTRLSWSGPGAAGPQVTRNGRLVFSRAVRDTNIWRLPLDRKDRGAPVLDKLASSSFREVFPQYSPDGKRLTFHSNRGGSTQVWIADSDGSGARQLTAMDPTAITGSARWSPDSQRIAFDSSAGGRTHVYVMSVQGGPPTPLTSGDSNNFTGAWSPDGRWIYFTSNRSGRPEIWRVPPSGGTPVRVTQNGAETGDLSPDGTWLYFVRNTGAGGLWRMPIEGGAEERLAETVYRYNYFPVEQGVYYATGAASDHSSMVRYLDFTTRKVTDIIKVEQIDLGLAVSPDRKYLLFTRVDYAGQDLMLVENFR